MLTLSHEQAHASLLNLLLLLTVPMVKPSTAPNANTACRALLKQGSLNPPHFSAQRWRMRSSISVRALPACVDKFLPITQCSCASTSGRRTHRPDPWGQSYGAVGRQLLVHFMLFRDQSLCLMFQKNTGSLACLNLVLPIFYNRIWLVNLHFSEEQQLETASKPLLYQAEMLPC